MGTEDADVAKTYELPADILGRLRLGREEFCQRLLTMLIVGGAYPQVELARNRPSERGSRFLRALDELSFGSANWDESPMFVDEIAAGPNR